MKKIIKSVITLAVMAMLGIATFFTTINIRGNYDDYILPNGFQDSIDNADTSRSCDTYARIMSANVLVHYKSWGGTDARKRAKMFFNIIDEYQPDVVAIQEMCDQWYCCIQKNKGNYELVYPISSGLLFHTTALMYNTQTVTLLDYGRMEYSQGDNEKSRRIVWGLFEENSTKKQYIVTSTHLDLIREGQENSELKTMNIQAQEQIELANQLQEKFNCPIICAGDFNAMDCGGYNDEYNAPSIYDTLSKAMTDTKYIAKSTTEGDNRTVSQPTFDHIFIIGNATVERYSILSDSVMGEMSDHYPLFADISD